MVDARVGQQVVVDVGVARRITVVPGEHDPLAVTVDHVVVHGGVPGVRVELNAAIGVVVDQVPFDPRAARRLDVDAMVVVGRRQLAAVMDPAARDQRVRTGPEAARISGGFGSAAGRDARCAGAELRRDIDPKSARQSAAARASGGEQSMGAVAELN